MFVTNDNIKKVSKLKIKLAPSDIYIGDENEDFF